MATIRNERDKLLQATSPRINPVPVIGTVSLSDTSQVLNNLPSFNRVTGVTNIATQSALANGGGFLTGFGGLSSLNGVALNNATQVTNNLPSYTRITGVTDISTQSNLSLSGAYITGNLPSFSRVTGLTPLATQSTLNLAGSFIVGDLAGNRIAANSITVDRLASGVGALSDPDFTFALNGSISTFLGNTAVGGATSSTSKPAATFLHASSGVGFSLISGTGSTNANAYAGAFAGNFNSLTGARACTAFLGSGSGVAGAFNNTASGNNVELATATYAVNINSGTLRYGGVTIQVPTGNAAHVLHGDGSWS